MRRTTKIFLLLLTIGILALSGFKWPNKTTEFPVTDQIEFTIRPYGQTPEQLAGTYYDGAFVPIQCIWKNNGPNPAKVWLQDHDINGGVSGHLHGLRAKVVDSHGKVLTDRDGVPNGFWTPEIMISQLTDLSKPTSQPGDVISLEAGEQVMRIANLRGFVYGPKGFTGLEPGDYVVQFSLGQLSNKLSITVAKRPRR